MAPTGEWLNGRERTDRGDETYVRLWRVTDVYFTIPFNSKSLIPERKKKKSSPHLIEAIVAEGDDLHIVLWRSAETGFQWPRGDIEISRVGDQYVILISYSGLILFYCI